MRSLKWARRRDSIWNQFGVKLQLHQEAALINGDESSVSLPQLNYQKSIVKKICDLFDMGLYLIIQRWH